MTFNIWSEVQEVRKIIALMKKFKGHVVEQLPFGGRSRIITSDARVVYESRSYIRFKSILYAKHCFESSESPTVLGLNEFYA